MVAVERLQDREVGVARRVERDPVVVQVRRCRSARARCSRRRSRKRLHLDHVLVQRELDRPVVGGRVVEQLQLQLVDRRFDQQVIDVRQLADDADRAVGDRRRERATCFGAKKRMYGSSDVSEKRSVISASISGVRARRPDPETERRFDEASNSIVSISAAQRQAALDLADAFVGRRTGRRCRSGRRSADSRTCRCRWRRTARMPESGARGNENIVSDSTGIFAPFASNE